MSGRICFALFSVSDLSLVSVYFPGPLSGTADVFRAQWKVKNVNMRECGGGWEWGGEKVFKYYALPSLGGSDDCMERREGGREGGREREREKKMKSSLRVVESYREDSVLVPDCSF